VPCLQRLPLRRSRISLSPRINVTALSPCSAVHSDEAMELRGSGRCVGTCVMRLRLVLLCSLPRRRQSSIPRDDADVHCKKARRSAALRPAAVCILHLRVDRRATGLGVVAKSPICPIPKRYSAGCGHRELPPDSKQKQQKGRPGKKTEKTVRQALYMKSAQAVQQPP